MYVKTSNVEGCDHLDGLCFGQNTLYPFCLLNPTFSEHFVASDSCCEARLFRETDR